MHTGIHAYISEAAFLDRGTGPVAFDRLLHNEQTIDPLWYLLESPARPMGRRQQARKLTMYIRALTYTDHALKKLYNVARDISIKNFDTTVTPHQTENDTQSTITKTGDMTTQLDSTTTGGDIETANNENSSGKVDLGGDVIGKKRRGQMETIKKTLLERERMLNLLREMLIELESKTVGLHSRSEFSIPQELSKCAQVQQTSERLVRDLGFWAVHQMMATLNVECMKKIGLLVDECSTNSVKEGKERISKALDLIFNGAFFSGHSDTRTAREGKGENDKRVDLHLLNDILGSGELRRRGDCLLKSWQDDDCLEGLSFMRQVCIVDAMMGMLIEQSSATLGLGILRRGILEKEMETMRSHGRENELERIKLVEHKVAYVQKLDKIDPVMEAYKAASKNKLRLHLCYMIKNMCQDTEGASNDLGASLRLNGLSRLLEQIAPDLMSHITKQKTHTINVNMKTMRLQEALLYKLLTVLRQLISQVDVLLSSAQTYMLVLLHEGFLERHPDVVSQILAVNNLGDPRLLNRTPLCETSLVPSEIQDVLSHKLYRLESVLESAARRANRDTRSRREEIDNLRLQANLDRRNRFASIFHQEVYSPLAAARQRTWGEEDEDNVYDSSSSDWSPTENSSSFSESSATSSDTNSLESGSWSERSGSHDSGDGRRRNWFRRTSTSSSLDERKTYSDSRSDFSGSASAFSDVHEDVYRRRRRGDSGGSASDSIDSKPTPRHKQPVMRSTAVPSDSGSGRSWKRRRRHDRDVELPRQRNRHFQIDRLHGREIFDGSMLEDVTEAADDVLAPAVEIGAVTLPSTHVGDKGRNYVESWQMTTSVTFHVDDLGPHEETMWTVPVKILTFCVERFTCIMLATYLSRRQSGRVSYVTGKAERGRILDMKMNMTIQQERLRRFRQKAMNRTDTLQIMVGTSVIEEGFDLPQCSAVICFDIPKHLAHYIQSRGRAREKNSVYVTFVEEETSLGTSRLQGLQKLEALTLKMCSLFKQPNPYKQTHISFTTLYESFKDKALFNPVGQYQHTT